MATVNPLTFDRIFAKAPVMAILRGMPLDKSVELATRAWDLGIECVEVPVQSRKSAEVLAAVVKAGVERGRPVGAGTVTTAERLAWAVSAGAAFTVAPGLDAGVARASLDAGLPHLPGVATATDVQAARALGLDWLKAFPASVLGPDWFRAMRGPFPEVPFVATGGIDASNAAAYLAAGARVVAVGSALDDPDQLLSLADLLKH
ncbi:bifunctional 4-hydroxy-2-oxoglutarate aldolase/2-dehydro-3-deoxy-phosphogluconate aldolase [Streptomyces griseoluteus]|uniref:Bifunctional 4-hydroxy-2-oxoglutarate aldolase/2-dehydro-3-deoxy-phosphogluconate aldolase n=1 Tax=Streptomyces griseoluteus TaxID=29306 RepID=A0A4Z1DC81_STRGP|nr:bifunctional 4-hydroxy-2-oxoglutarate aldolase/2-dehydro-3-deoxy-phosphogluconate aldolase [Streptomyces griseoluteus]TGN80063.1 bifunctional 4-hydroxy-2-oxoglutarate aldolase/2-dehydro-3-deoxy-phosphogluconate aldolase [Streptomyces griseoluteus]GHF32726.1 ketohydroxyglutarate aldolase [Streptomyces griseoluteus]